MVYLSTKLSACFSDSSFTVPVFPRFTMEVGGCDMTRMFFDLLTTLGWQPGLNLAQYPDALACQDLKESLCHFDHVGMPDNWEFIAQCLLDLQCLVYFEYNCEVK